MVAVPDTSGHFTGPAERARQLRAQAAECRDLMRVVSYRPDRDQLEKMAERCDAEAARLEAKASAGEPGA
jgi:hypothetical protein